MVAIHAWRSADAIERFKARYPACPVVLQLSGTDIYEYLRSDPGADAARDGAGRPAGRPERPCVQSRPEGTEEASPHHSSVGQPPTQARRPSTRAVVVAVIGHLRDVKDPLRAAEAARLLPAESRIRIEQVGRAYTAQWAARARAEMKANKRYRWRDDVPAASVRTPAGAQPRDGDLVDQRGGGQRDLRGRRRRRAGAGLAHGRQCRSARQPITPATSPSETRGRLRDCSKDWSGSRPLPRFSPKPLPAAHRSFGRRARRRRGGGCLRR